MPASGLEKFMVNKNGLWETSSWHRRALVTAEIMRAVYSRLLEKMRLDRWRIFDRRYSLGKLTKLWLVLRGWLSALG